MHCIATVLYVHQILSNYLHSNINTLYEYTPVRTKAYANNPNGSRGYFLAKLVILKHAQAFTIFKLLTVQLRCKVTRAHKLHVSHLLVALELLVSHSCFALMLLLRVTCKLHLSFFMTELLAVNYIIILSLV